jgi:hypothetical protein
MINELDNNSIIKKEDYNYVYTRVMNNIPDLKFSFNDMVDNNLTISLNQTIDMSLMLINMFIHNLINDLMKR